MEFEIKNGVGDGNVARVDSNHRLHTLAVNRTASENASGEGYSYNLNTGIITLTSSARTPVGYLKNNGNNDIRVTSIGFQMMASSGGSGRILTEIVKTPNAGTVISGATKFSIIENKNAGSSREVDADVFKGGTGLTLTGGKDFYQSLIPSAPFSYVIATGDIVLTKGSSIGIFVTPPSGNTSVEFMLFMAIAEEILV